MRSRLRTVLVSAIGALAAAAASLAQTDDLERSVALMAKIGSATSPSFSPDGRTIAYVTNLGGLPQVWTVDAAGGYPQLVTALDDPVGFVEWSPDGVWLAFTLAPGGGMNEQVYLVRPDGTGMKRLTEGGKETNRLGPWSHDGTLLVLGSNKRSGAAIDSYVYDVASGASRLATENRGIGGYEDLSRDKKFALLNRLVNRGDNDLYLVDLASGRETLLTPHEGPGNFSGAVREGRPRRVPRDGRRPRPHGLRAHRARRGGTARQDHDPRRAARRRDLELRARRCRDDAPRFSGTSPAGATSSSSTSRPASSIVRPKLPAEIAGGLDFSRDGKSLALVVSGAATPADIWIMDVGTGAFRQVTKSPHAGVDLAKLVRPELVRFKAHDGLELSGWLYEPRSGRGAVPDGALLPRRPRGPGAADLQQPLPGAALARHRGLRAERPRLLGLRKALRQPRQRRAARRGRQGHQGLRRRGRARPASPTPSASGSWAAPTAATWSWPA